MRIAMIGQKGFDVGARGGGVERHVTEISRRLVQSGHKVTVYARFRYGGTSDSKVEIRYVWTVYSKYLETFVHTLLCTMDALFCPYDVIHYHGVGPATLAWIPRLLKRKAKVVVTFHSQDRFHSKWGPIGRLYLYFGEWAAVWLPHETIAVSHFLQVYAREHLKKQIAYIPNGASVETVHETNELDAFGLTPKHYLLSVSRLEPHKGQWYLIEAFKRLEQSDTLLVQDIDLVIVGAVGYARDYQAQLKRLARGSAKIKFLGYQTGDALKQLFAHALLFVHASWAEGLPIVVLEAMSYGAPVLVSDIPENLEVIHHVGNIFENKSVEDLTLRLRELLLIPEGLDGTREAGQDLVRKEFSWDIIAKKTEAIYRSVSDA
jgi:glycosyltransferase involved in cell wall biosynthesis